MFRHRLLIALAAIATALVLIAADAQARAGGGFSGGSRGLRTFSAPPPRAPRRPQRAPIQRTITQPGGAAPLGQARARARSVRRRIVRRAGRRISRRRIVRAAVRTRIFWRHGRLCLDPRPAVAGRAGRVRRAAGSLPGGSGVISGRLMRRRIRRPGTTLPGLGGMFGGSHACRSSRSPSPRRTTMRSSNCSATSRPRFRPKT